jgi:hypothetical protein
MNGFISEEALAEYSRLAAEKLGMDFAEGDSYDFTTCIRPDGSSYGTSGKCRKGTETSSSSGSKKATRGQLDAAKNQYDRLKEDVKAAKKAQPKPDLQDTLDAAKNQYDRLKEAVKAAKIAQREVIARAKAKSGAKK